MTRSEQAQALRADAQVHYNCCQAVLLPFCEDCGLSRETAMRLGAPFGGGMKMGATCGAVTGGLMVLGMLGATDEQTKRFRDAFRARNGALDCAALLKAAHEQGVERKCHCDDMVFQAVALVEELTAR